MDDTTTQQPNDMQNQQMPTNMSDMASMTPPMPAPTEQAPGTDMSMNQGMQAAQQMEPSMPAVPAPVDPAAMQTPGVSITSEEGKDDYTYAEDILNEILDSLDRIEAKIDGLEKKG